MEIENAGAIDAGPSDAPSLTAVLDIDAGHAPDVALDSGPPRDPRAPSDVEAVPPDASVSESGLGFRLLSAVSASGESPTLADEVSVRFTAWRTDGSLHSETGASPRPLMLREQRAGVQEGLLRMLTGETARLWIPESLAHVPDDGGHGMLVFDIELVSISRIPPAPADVAAPPKNARRTKKGVHYVVLVRGKGRKRAKLNDEVEVHYSGWTTDGKLIDSSVKRGRPNKFRPEHVIRGWTDVLTKMRVGAKWRVWIPKELAYGDKPNRPQGMLVYEIEVLGITTMPRPPKTPRDVERPPARAKSTEGGVRYRYLKRAAKSRAKPLAADRVVVHYSGWTTDGKMFDSSVKRGRPAEFRASAVIAGWTEALLVMRVGDKIRVWIPEELAYNGRAGAPKGMLVFDIELIEIKPSTP